MKDLSKDKLAAYALNELPEQERREVENYINENPSLKKEVEEIKNFGVFLSQELKGEELPRVTDSLRSSLLKEMSEQEPKESLSLLNFLKGSYFQGGALVAAVFGLLIFFSLQQEILDQESDGSQGLQTGMAIKDEAIRPELMPGEGQTEPKKSDGASVVGRPNQKAGSRARALGKGTNNLEVAQVGASGAISHSPLKRKKILRRPVPPHGFVGGDEYQAFSANIFKSTQTTPLSTFSIDVDTASYANIRRYIQQSSQLPPHHAVRIEEMINYFDYSDPAPKNNQPFKVSLEVADSPWAEGRQLVRVGIKGKEVTKKNYQSNLVFLVDVSGSMDSHDKIGLLKSGLHKLVEKLDGKDHVSLVTYAGNAAVILDATSGDNKEQIHRAIDNLTGEGSTHGSEGIKTAYELADKNFRPEGINRVILATDGDFNIGTTSDEALINLVEEKAKKNVFLTVLGFGRGNLNDSMMEKVSNKGNGNYFYLDTEREAQKVLVEKLQGTLMTIAKDVKIQVEFNPENVSEYRLIGYENRQLKAKDFNNDKKDAGEIGAGHSVVALYEIKPTGYDQEGVDPLKYQKDGEKAVQKQNGKFSEELLTVKVRYKKPEGKNSSLLKFPLQKKSRPFEKASADLRWTASVAGFGMLLKNSEHKGDLTYPKLIEMADKARWSYKGYNEYKAEFIELIKKSQELAK